MLFVVHKNSWEVNLDVVNIGVQVCLTGFLCG